MCIVLLVCFAMLLGFDWLLIRVDWLVGVLSLVDCLGYIVLYRVCVWYVAFEELFGGFVNSGVACLYCGLDALLYLFGFDSCLCLDLFVSSDGLVWVECGCGYFSVLGRSDGCCIVCFV